MDSSISALSLGTRSLQRKVPLLSSYQIQPITKHYWLNEQILAAFESNYEQKIYITAYALGMQFVETALLEIPKHGYFYSPRHERERMNSSLAAVQVAQALKDLQKMTEVTAEPNEIKHVERLYDLAVEQVQQASFDQSRSIGTAASNYSHFETQRAKTEEDLRVLQGLQQFIVCEPLLACSESFSLCPDSSQPQTGNEEQADWKVGRLDTQDEATRAMLLMPPPFPRKRIQTAPAWYPEAWNAPKGGGSLKSPIPQLLPSVSLSSIDAAAMSAPPMLRRQSTDSIQLEKALFLSGLEVAAEKYEETGDGRFVRQSQRLALATLSTLFQEDFDSLREVGRVRISYVRTYQGRLPESTNGCTVIAPLLCIHHLVEADGSIDTTLTDAAIEHVIDRETPAILTELRTTLGLSAQAFLIPSDAHDYLIHNGQLSQQQFVNVLGGNIMDEGHLRAFVTALEDVKHGRLAATLFFHEHVVAILKVQFEGQNAWYDIVDSLPLKATLMRSGETVEGFHQRLGLDESIDELTNAFLPMTARMRCLDAEALLACLRWYACSKFHDENISYIDQYAWDDNSCDFDPRVFQAFIWSQVPQ